MKISCNFSGPQLCSFVPSRGCFLDSLYRLSQYWNSAVLFAHEDESTAFYTISMTCDGSLKISGSHWAKEDLCPQFLDTFFFLVFPNGGGMLLASSG